jgi:hypothetical protein
VKEFDPQFVLDKTFSKFKAFRHLVFKCLICGTKEFFKKLSFINYWNLEPDLK